MIVTFCGHSEIDNEREVENWLNQVIAQLRQNEKVTFYLGGYGAFDRMAARTVHEHKQYAAGFESVYVLPYLNRKVDLSLYDSTVFPPLENTPPRFAILKRNQWMVDESELVVAYVRHSWGGAANLLEYAKKRDKKTVAYPNLLQL